jgi:hypothetical protein
VTVRKSARRNPPASKKAAKFAAREIDRLGDRSATTEEREKRKRRLLKGPAEFRDIRDRKRKA